MFTTTPLWISCLDGDGGMSDMLGQEAADCGGVQFFCLTVHNPTRMPDFKLIDLLQICLSWHSVRLEVNEGVKRRLSLHKHCSALQW